MTPKLQEEIVKEAERLIFDLVDKSVAAAKARNPQLDEEWLRDKLITALDVFEDVTQGNPAMISAGWPAVVAIVVSSAAERVSARPGAYAEKRLK